VLNALLAVIYFNLKNSLTLLFCLLFLSASQGRAQSLKINEFQTRNVSTIPDNYMEYDDWIEIRNLSGADIDLNGYFITDDLSNKTKFSFAPAGTELVVPANGYLMLWADDDEKQGSNHLSFNISGKGGLIALFSPALQLIDSVSYPEQSADLSMGREPDPPYSFMYFLKPTPGRINNTQSFKGRVNSPVIHQKSGFYTAPLNVSITAPDLLDSIFYTGNNTTPSSLSPLYLNPLPVQNTRLVNAVAAKSGYINSKPSHGLYIFHPVYTLPTLAILTDSFNLFGPAGIYTNYNETWEKYSRISYFSNGELKLEADAGLRIQGASSTFMAKKGFRFFFRGDYGTPKLEYPMFGTGHTSTFQKLVVKPGYDDDMTMNGGTLLRDALALELWNKTGGMKQLSSWVILYLNNQYWGIYNMRESVDENYIKAHTALDKFDLIRFRNEGPDLEYGTLDNWNDMYNLITQQDMSVPENYQQAAAVLDMDEFANLMAFIQCTVYYSWGWGISMFRDNQAGAVWNLTIWDADRAFNNPQWNGFEEVKTKTNDLYWGNNIPKNLMKSPLFRQKYSLHLHTLLQTVFRPDKAIAVLDSLYTIIKPEMQGELARWTPDNKKWEQNVQAIRDFLMSRPTIVANQMYDYLPFVTGLPDAVLAETVNVFPNPFTDHIQVSLNIVNPGNVNISVFDQAGRMIKTLYSGKANTGVTNLQWYGDSDDGPVVPPGVYIIRISTPDQLYHYKIIRQ
jgi:hypothetical protein